jgi:hypothetical protein
VRLDVVQPAAQRAAEAGQRAHLIQDQVVGLGRIDLHFAPAEPLQIGQCRVRAHRHPAR